MPDWSREFAHLILESEGNTTATWGALSGQLREAVAEINTILEKSSKTRLLLTEAPNLLTLDSHLKASFNLDSHARAMSLVIDRTVYNFRFTAEPTRVNATSTPLIPGAVGNSPVELTEIIKYAIKAVVDLR